MALAASDPKLTAPSRTLLLSKSESIAGQNIGIPGHFAACPMETATTATVYWIQSTVNWHQALCPLPLEALEDYCLEQEKRPLMNRYDLAPPPQDSAFDMDDPVSEYSDIASSVPSSESWQSSSDDPCSEQYSRYLAPSFSTHGFTHNDSPQMTDSFHRPQGPEPSNVDEPPAGFTPGMLLGGTFNWTLTCWYGPLSHANSCGYFGNLDYWTLPRLAIDMPHLAHDGEVLNKCVASEGENITRNSSADSDRTAIFMDTPGPSPQPLLGPSTDPQKLLGGPYQTFGHSTPASTVPDPPQTWTCPVEGCTKTLNQRHKFK